ncbi:MAG: TonB-dependent receptor domain-containing protein [Lysobacter sp.]
MQRYHQGRSVDQHLHTSTSSTGRRQRPAVSALAAACLLFGLQSPSSWAQTAEPATDARKQIDIAAQDLHSALQQLALVSERQMLYRSEIVAGLRSTAVQGNYTLAEALRGLLAGTGLEFEVTTEAVVLIKPAGGGTSRARRDSATRDVNEMSSVVVTARKREERQIDVPIAMNSISGEQIDAFGISKIADVIDSTPAASTVDTGGGRTQVQIRGVSSSLGGNDNGYYLDEVPFTGVTVPWYPDVRSFDIDRIEILKGPQGTLFGEGSMGGTVRVLTRKPDFNYFNAAVELSASSTKGGGNGWGGKGMVNVPLIDDKLALRVAVTDEFVPGWIDNITTGKKDINEQRVKTGRFKLRFAPTEQWTMDLAHWKYDSKAPGGNNNSANDLTTRSFYAITGKWDVTTFATTYDFEASQLFYAFADADMLDVTDGKVNPTTPYQAVFDIGVRTQELRWASTGDRRFDWTVGYYLREAGRDDSSSLGGSPPSVSSQTNDAYAFFGETSLKMPNPAYTLSAGLRYFNDEVSARSDAAGRSNVLVDTFDDWSPRLSLSYKPSAGVTIYASAATGFRSGQLQPITSTLLAEQNGIDLPKSVKPDSIRTYELGAKSSMLDDKVLVEGAVFYSDWQDVAVRVPVAPSINGLMNSEGTRTRGAEFNLYYTPSSALTLQMGGSVVDAVYVAPVPTTPIVRGTAVYNVPKVNFSTSASYSWPVGDALTGIARVAARHDSARKTGLGVGTPGDAITLLNARIGLESAMGWSAFLYGDNLTDEDGAINSRSRAGVANHPRPRTFGVQLRYDY